MVKRIGLVIASAAETPLRKPPLPLSPGDLLAGKYRVERVLGVGGMGAVVAARHTELGEMFAVKLLLAHPETEPLAVERFLREARAAARLVSPHAARVVDVGRLESGVPFMVMEHLTGTDLHKLLRKEGPLPVDLAITAVMHACDAMAEAHSLGIIHRDIKPANLFLTRRPNGAPWVKVLDFGISKQLGPEQGELTRTHDVMGSPYYMAPEQMSRARDAEARSDVWSLGAALFELLTGKVPFFGESLTEIVAAVLREDPPDVTSLRPDLPPVLDEIIHKCLQKRPADRYPTVVDLMEALAAVLPPGRASISPEVGALVGRPSAPSVAPGLLAPAATESQAPPPPGRASTSPPVLLREPTVVPSPAGSISSGWGTTARAMARLRGNKGAWTLAFVTIGSGALAVIGYVALGPSADPGLSTSALSMSSTAPPPALTSTDRAETPADTASTSVTASATPAAPSNAPSTSVTASATPSAPPSALSSTTTGLASASADAGSAAAGSAAPTSPSAAPRPPKSGKPKREGVW